MKAMSYRRPPGRRLPGAQRWALALALTAILGAASAAQAAVKPPQIKLAYEKYTLPNGLEVILREDHRLPIVAVNTWYHVGPAFVEQHPQVAHECVRAVRAG